MKPILITCQPQTDYFIWQNHLYIESCLEQGFEQNQIQILLYKQKGENSNKKWETLKKYYPNINIFVYEDKGIQQFLSIYIPVLRPHILWQHFEAFPELQDRTIVYTDCDILWTDNININQLLEDDINYVSDASSYLNHSYFERKNKEIKENTELNERDFLKEICDIVGISKAAVIANNDNTGGVQYILKNIDATFWKKVEKDVINIRKHLLSINKEFYKDENSGIQSWCADLWSVQFNLWFFNKETKVTPLLDFAWSTDSIDKIKTFPILHNAGISGDYQNGYPAFYKGKYHLGSSPFKDEHLNIVLENKESQKHCTHYYTTKLKQLKIKYNINN